MNYLTKINDIIKKLELDNKTVAKEIILLRDGANTSSELLMSITHKLLLLIKENKKINRLVGEETLELENYCFSVGLHINTNGKKKNKNN